MKTQKPMPPFKTWDECFNYWAKNKQKKYPYFLEWLKLKFKTPIPKQETK